MCRLLVTIRLTRASSVSGGDPREELGEPSERFSLLREPCVLASSFGGLRDFGRSLVDGDDERRGGDPRGGSATARLARGMSFWAAKSDVPTHRPSLVAERTVARPLSCASFAGGQHPAPLRAGAVL
jgi:hypothetical protein